MKKYACFWFSVGSFLSYNAFATDILVEAQAAYYYPTDDEFQEIYSGSGIYGLEVSVQAWKGLYAWTSGSIFTKSGHSEGLDSSTHITFIPLGVGLKYLWKVNFVDLYLGAGALPTYLHIHDHSPYVVQKISKWGCGVIGKVGAIFNLPQSFFLDLFTHYSYTSIPNHNTQNGTVYTSSANISGFSFGGGVGYRFGSR